MQRTGCQWNALPRSCAASSTAHRRFQEWEAGGFFRQLCKEGLTEYDALQGIEWEWQAVDGAMAKSPFGGAAPGPTRLIGQEGVKRSLQSDGRGIPLAIVAPAANRHYKVLMEVTLDAAVVSRPEPSEEVRQHLSLDRGYDYDTSREGAASRGYEVHIPQPRG